MQSVTIKGIRTDFYQRVGSNKTVKVLIIPGNPGIIGFYKSFIDTLFSAFDEEFTVVGVGHAGHGARGQNGSSVFSLDEQVEHKASFMEYLGSKSKFVLMGHSIGSWFILKLLKRHPRFNVLHIFHLFPTFTHLWRGFAPAVKVLVQPGVRHALAGVVQYAPAWLITRILKFTKGLTDEAKYVTTSNADYYVALNILSMAAQEGREILEIDAECRAAISENMPIMTFLYGPNDAYAPRAFYEDLKATFSGVNAHLAPDFIAHAFVLRYHAEVAEIVVGWLRDVFDGVEIGTTADEDVHAPKRAKSDSSALPLTSGGSRASELSSEKTRSGRKRGRPSPLSPVVPAAAVVSAADADVPTPVSETLAAAVWQGSDATPNASDGGAEVVSERRRGVTPKRPLKVSTAPKTPAGKASRELRALLS